MLQLAIFKHGQKIHSNGYAICSACLPKNVRKGEWKYFIESISLGMQIFHSKHTYNEDGSR